MKKLLIPLFLSILVVIGCENAMNTPTAKVEEFLGTYQKMDSAVLEELNYVIEKNENMTEEQKETYRTLLEKQYQNLAYKIKEEEIEGETASVEVEIEVLDYKTSIDKSKKYYLEHIDELEEDNFLEETEEIVEDKVEEINSFLDYKLEQLKNVSDKTKYTITFNLTKEDGVWVMDDLSEEDIEKIHGLY